MDLKAERAEVDQHHLDALIASGVTPVVACGVHRDSFGRQTIVPLQVDFRGTLVVTRTGPQGGARNMESKTATKLDDIGDVQVFDTPAVEPLGLDAGHLPPEVASRAPYVVLVVNSTDHVIRMVRINKGAWSATPLIGRTCDRDDWNYCVDKRAYKPLCTVNCGSNVQIDVAWKRADQWYWTYWDSFYADCNYAGGVIWLSR